MCPAWRHLYRNKQPTTYDQQQIDAAIKEYFKLKKADQENNFRLKDLGSTIRTYMEQEGLTRVFGDDGSISKTTHIRHKYNFDAIRTVLEPLGLWQKILGADEKKLKLLMKTFPEDVQKKVQELGVETKEFTMLKVSTKKIKKPEEITSDEETR